MNDSVGARLRQAREARRLSLQQVSESTKLRTHYLQALENDDYSAIPSGAQARGFLRLYAEFLQLDLAELIPAQPVAPAAPVAEAVKPAPAASPRPNLLSGLLGRFGRRSGADMPAAQPEVAAVPEPALPVEASTPVVAATEVETARRPKPASNEVKKKAGS